MKTFKWTSSWLALALIILLLPGCMYGDRIKKSGAPATGEYLALVQSAMEQYQNKHGILPIRNKDAVQTEYERYLIDFKKLQDDRLITTVPVNAFENGGSAVYVVAHTETKPIVRLMDLVSYQQIVNLQQEVDRYKSAHNGEAPTGEAVTDGFWQPDYDALKVKREPIRSPFNPVNLYPIMDENGTVAVDYTPDILKVIQKKGLKPGPEQDLRELLVEEGIFVPAVSFPYHWNGQSPVPVPAS